MLEQSEEVFMKPQKSIKKVKPLGNVAVKDAKSTKSDAIKARGGEGCVPIR